MPSGEDHRAEQILASSNIDQIDSSAIKPMESTMRVINEDSLVKPSKLKPVVKVSNSSIAHLISSQGSSHIDS